MRSLQDRDSGSFVNAPRLHADEAILNQIDPADSMRAPQLVKLLQNRHGPQLLSVDLYGFALLETDLDVLGLGLCGLRRARELENTLRWFRPGVFQDPPLI